MTSGAGPDVGGDGDGAALTGWRGADVEAALAGQPERVSGPIVDHAPVVVTIDAGPAGCWTVRVERDGRLLRTPGMAKGAHARIRAGASTLVAMLSGRESGVGAFLDGRLLVRGSLGLALLLEGALLRPELALIAPPISHGTAVAGLRQMFAVPERLEPAWYDAAADEFLRVMRGPRGRIAFFATIRQIYVEEAFGAGGFWERLPGLRPPALFLWGERDRLVPHTFERHVVQALPGCESVLLPECGHVPQFELPGETHRLIRSFLARVAAAPG